MNRLIIIGAGGFGREVFSWALAVTNHQYDWSLGGFLDSNSRALEDFGYPLEIIGDPDSYLPQENDRFICAIGDPKAKLDICQRLEARGAKFVNLVHPSAVIGYQSEIGRGCILCPGSLITVNAKIGSFVTLNVHATVGHDATIGDGCTLSGHADVTGNVQLGKGVFLGSHAVVLPNVKIGDFVTVGAGSAVLRSAKSHSTVFGVPAKQAYSPPRRGD